MESNTDFTGKRLPATFTSKAVLFLMTIIAGSSQSSSLRYLETQMVANKETSSEDIAPSEVRLEEDKYGRRDSDTTIVSRENVGKLSNSRKHGKGLTEGDNG